MYQIGDQKSHFIISRHPVPSLLRRRIMHPRLRALCLRRCLPHCLRVLCPRVSAPFSILPPTAYLIYTVSSSTVRRLCLPQAPSTHPVSFNLQQPPSSSLLRAIVYALLRHLSLRHYLPHRCHLPPSSPPRRRPNLSTRRDGSPLAPAAVVWAEA